jgi:hypothetical protein
MRTDGAQTRDGQSTAGTLAYILFGPIIWALHLSLIYFWQSMLCAHGLAGARLFGASIVPLVIALGTAAGLLLLLVPMLAPARVAGLLGASGWDGKIARFNTRIMIGLAVLSSLGIAWGGITVLFLPICGQGR